MRSKPILSATLVRELFDYAPQTGAITWRHHAGKARNYRAGKPAGTKTNPTRGSGCSYLKVGIRVPGEPTVRLWAGGHQIAWAHHYGTWPTFPIDHRDGNGLNNAISNLRPATHSLNARNQCLHKTNRSGIAGVVWHARASKWQSSAGRVDPRTGKRHCDYLGLHTTLLDAAAARKSYDLQNAYGPAHGVRRAA